MVGAKKRSLMLLDPDVLDCPVCYETLTIPIFQCDNGHLACSSCCPRLRNKCHACALPIGHIRCRAMENILESIFVPCPNVSLGCTKKLPYGKESTHEKECTFSQCSCPALNCNYSCSYKYLYDHVKTHTSLGTLNCGSYYGVVMNISDKIKTLRDLKTRLVFAVQCFREPCGVYVTVSCIAPCSPEVGEFSYHLSYTVDRHTVSYESPEVKRILEVSFQIPQENFMLIPHSLLRGNLLRMDLCIKKLNQG